MNRRLRKYPQHHPSEGDQLPSEGRRPPYGLIWLALTIIVLVLVLLYDRRSISDAERHIASGHELETKGLFMEALNEYDEAYHNRRLGRKAKARAALAMAEIYYSHLEDYPAAHKYYLQARQESPSVFSTPELQQHAKSAAARAQGAGVFKSRNTRRQNGVTTQTIIQRVELIAEPLEDRRGPVMARYSGGEINAGQVLRELQHRPEFNSAAFRENPEELKAFVNKLLRSDMAYEAAVRSELHKDPDVSTRLYDYQKQLVTQRYLVDRRDLALKVDNEDVVAYYNAHQEEFNKPGTIDLSLIKADTESSATELLKMLRSGAAFQDVATSYSTDKASARARGSVGVIADTATTIPGVGDAASIMKPLFKLPVQSISDVVPVNGAFYIFRIDNVKPAMHITLDEARGRIENLLRGKAVDIARHKLDSELDSALSPKLDEDGFKQFWNFVQANTSGAESKTSSSLQAAPQLDVSANGSAKTTATQLLNEGTSASQ